MKFCGRGEKMRNASSHQGENERQWKKSEKEQARYFFHKGDVTQDDTQRRFLAQHSVESML